VPGKTCFLNIQWKQKSCSPKCVFCPPRNLKTWLRPCSVTDRRRPHKRLSQIRTWQAFRFLFFPNSPSKTHRQRAVYSRCADKSLAARHLTRLTRSSCAETDLPANSIFHGRSWSAFKYAAEYISTHISMVVFFLMLQIFISLLDAPLWRHPYGLVAFVSYRACPPHPIKRRFAIRANNVQSVHSSSLCLSGGSRFFFFSTLRKAIAWAEHLIAADTRLRISDASSREEDVIASWKKENCFVIPGFRGSSSNFACFLATKHRGSFQWWLSEISGGLCGFSLKLKPMSPAWANEDRDSKSS